MSASTDLSRLTAELRTLTANVIASEQRMQRMERRNRVVFAALLGALGVSLYLGFNGAGNFGGAPALAEGTGNITAPEVAIDTTKAELIKARTDLDHRIDAMRASLAEGKDIDSGKLIAVLLKDVGDALKDVSAALKAVPVMADNMQSMSRDMHVMTASVDQMNHKMTVMTGSINSTMGRMGRMMPWW